MITPSSFNPASLAALGMDTSMLDGMSEMELMELQNAINGEIGGGGVGGVGGMPPPVAEEDTKVPVMDVKAKRQYDGLTTGFSPLQDNRITQSSWLARYRLASDVTQLVQQRAKLPEDVVRASLEKEASLNPTDLAFEVHDTDSADSSGGSYPPENVLVDDSRYWQNYKTQNAHITFVASGKDTEFILQEVQFRGMNGYNGYSALVFVGQKEPDLDSFSWCDNFTQAHYDRFVAKKKSSKQSWRAHEPVAFMTTYTHTASVKLDVPRRGRYITLKFSCKYGGCMYIEFVKFICLHGSHPLGKYIGTPLLESKAKELHDSLLKAGLALNAGSSSSSSSSNSSTSSDEKVISLAPSPEWTLSMDENLVSMVQSMCNKLSLNIRALDTVMFSPTPDELMRYKSLESVPLDTIRARFALIKYINQLVTPLLHYVDIRVYEKHKFKNRGGQKSKSDSHKQQQQLEQEIKDADALLSQVILADTNESEYDEKSLSYVVHQLKGMYFMSTKRSVFEALLSLNEGTDPNNSGYRPSRGKPITINRIKAARARENPGKDPNGLKSVFGQVFLQCRGSRPDSYKGKKNEQMFNVTFLGEGSYDVGGPYRECLSNMCTDLMSDATPLFIKSPNQRNNVGLNREKWVINPSCSSSLHIAMYEFVGILMGIALRTSFTLNLDLPQWIWKQLLDEDVDQADLEAVDKLCIQALTELSNLNKQKFDYLVMEKFTTQSSDGKEIEVKNGGKDIPVTYESRDEFVKLSIYHRLHESDAQVRAIKKGLRSVVPANMLTLFSGYDLELMVCGNPMIDLKILRKHTIYKKISPSSSVVKNLWKCLESFNMEERQLFLRFVWGRSRLPVSENDWSHDFSIVGLKHGDDKLPISHTCFFTLDLPMYSSYEVMRKKILFAIFNCQAIDIDFNPDQSSLNAWVES